MKKDSWLHSDSFLKRAFAIWGYNFVASVIILIPLYVVMIGIAIAVGIFMTSMKVDMQKQPAPFDNDDIQFEELDMQDFQLELDAELEELNNFEQ